MKKLLISPAAFGLSSGAALAKSQKLDDNILGDVPESTSWAGYNGLLRSSFARWAGVVLTLLAATFFVKSLLELDPVRLADLPIVGLLASVASWSIFYALLLVGVSVGFVNLIHASGHRSALPREGLVIWGKANIAKYLPSNVLHFAGRQLIGARFGWPQGSIAAASLFEIGLQVLLPCGTAVLLLVVFGRWAMVEEAGGWLVPFVLVAAVGVMLVLFGRHLRPWLPRRMLEPLARLVLPHPAALLPAVVWYLLFFIGMCLIVWSLYAMVAGYITLRQLPILSIAFLISWVMGFVIPGAPGGIGVREGSFALLGGVFLTPDILVIVALLMRFVTLLGEGLIFLVALQVGRSTASRGADRDRLSPEDGCGDVRGRYGCDAPATTAKVESVQPNLSHF